MTPLNQCSVCGQDFASLKAFDNHILSGPSDRTFCCMSVEEMQKAGWVQNTRGRWTSPELVERAERLRAYHRDRGCDVHRSDLAA